MEHNKFYTHVSSWIESYYNSEALNWLKGFIEKSNQPDEIKKKLQQEVDDKVKSIHSKPDEIGNDSGVVTEQSAYIGMPVKYFVTDKAIGVNTEVLTSPRIHKGILCVCVAMVGEPVPLATLKAYSPVLVAHGSMMDCSICKATAYQLGVKSMQQYTLFNKPFPYYLCDGCATNIRNDGKNIEPYLHT